MNQPAQKTEVVVVGAGFAGLSAALELQQAGVDFRLLEARERVGGRVEAGRNGLGELLDKGGQFFCDDMPEIMELMRLHGKMLVRSPAAGNAVMQPSRLSGRRVGEIYAEATEARERLRAIDPADPVLAGLTVQAWAESQHMGAEARQTFLAMIEGLWCRPVRDLPAWYIASNDRRITNTVSELQYFCRETMYSLADDLGRSLGPRLVLEQPVERIETGPDGVTVHARSVTYQASRAIVAVPPVMARRMEFQPLLPVPIRQALAAWESGTVIKVFVRYRSAFWREARLSGSISWLDIRGLYACDASPDDGHAALVVFIGGEIATTWGASGEAHIRHTVLSRLAAALGPAAADPLDFTLRDWSGDGWSGGGYSDTVMAMDGGTAEDVIRGGAPGIGFASSELSPSFPGYIEGAIIAGRLEACATIARIRRGVLDAAG